MRIKFLLNKNIEFIKIDAPENDLKLFSVPKEQLIGRRIDSFIAIESAESFLAAILNGLRGINQKNIPIIINKSRGEQTCVLLHIQAIEENNTLNCELVN